ncbi:MAG: FtsQ-type POTRA domain-containing protein [Syntrophales bacterium]|nr:FtsQ-type POTRA domain-containing protein [Syntrophales bacterium]
MTSGISTRTFRKKQYRLEVLKQRTKRHFKEILREILSSLFILFSVLLLSLCGVYLYAQIITLPCFEVKDVVVRGARKVREEEILKLANVQKGRCILNIDLEGVATRVKLNPWVREAFVGREYPDRIVIEVREREPVAFLCMHDGFYFVDSHGVVFKKVSQDDEVDLPVLTLSGDENDGWASAIERYLDLLRYLSTRSTYPRLEHVAEVHWSSKEGFLLFTTDGYGLRIGTGNFEEKLRYLASVIADLDKRQVKGGFLMVDLNNPGQITVQMRNVVSPRDVVPLKGRYKI